MGDVVSVRERQGPARNDAPAEPAVEALMVGGVANAHYAFISQGRPTRTVGKK